MFKKIIFLKKIRYIVETPFVWLGLRFFLLFKVQTSSNIGAKLAYFFGKNLAVSKLAKANINNALPHLGEDEVQKIIKEMWENLGRIIGEFSHIFRMPSRQLLEFVNIDAESNQNIADLVAQNRGGIIFSAHFGNWEVGPRIMIHKGMRVKTFYRPLNNPYVEKMTSSLRGIGMIEKGSSGNRQLVSAIKNKEFVIIMADQKVTDGEQIKFFHENAITASSIAKIAMKYDIPLIPGYISRIGGQFKFDLKVEKPLPYKDHQGKNIELNEILREMNRKIELWIKSSPSQWFWVHNRWKK
jgi:KDO2-lipid IV(A) lauroyltransferase